MRFWSNILFLFRTRFGNGFLSLPLEVRNDSCKMILLSSSTRGFVFLLKKDTSILLRTRFEAGVDLLILLSFSARGLKLVFKR